MMHSFFGPATSEQIAHQLGITPVDLNSRGEPIPAPWGLAEMIRKEVRRNSIVTRQELRKKLEPQLQIAGVHTDPWSHIRNIAEELVTVGELMDLRVDHQRGYAALPGRWIRLGDSLAAFLGASEAGELCYSAGHPLQFVRRFDIENPCNLKFLNERGIKEVSLEEWLGTFDWPNVGPRNANLESLSELWSWQCSELQQHGTPILLSETKIQVVGGVPGDFFGSPGESNGRWCHPTDLPDGFYLGAQPGYQDRHWRPIIVFQEAGNAQSLMLNGGVESDPWELFSWLLIARGLSVGRQEKIRYDRTNHRLRLTFRVPRQVDRLMKLVGESIGKWEYHVSHWEQVRKVFVQAIPGIEWD